MSGKQYVFGAGKLWGIPLQDSSGAAVTVPTPVLFGVLQDISLDFSFDVKKLYGENQFPVAIGRGKGNVSAKAKNAQINGRLYASLYFGQTLATGTVADYIDSSAGTAIPTTPFTITTAPPNSGVFAKNLGVRNASTGDDMTRVASAPTAGQYSLVDATGVYTFASADNVSGVKVLIDYQYTVAASGTKLNVLNVPMGYVPTFAAEMALPYAGKTMTVTFPNAVSTKLTFATKLDDFTIPEFDFEGFEDASGRVMTLSWS